MLHSHAPFLLQPVTHTESLNRFSHQRFQLGLSCPPRLRELGTNSALTARLLIKHLPPLMQAVSNLKWHCCYIHSYFSGLLRNACIYLCLGKPSPLSSLPASFSCLFWLFDVHRYLSLGRPESCQRGTLGILETCYQHRAIFHRVFKRNSLIT